MRLITIVLLFGVLVGCAAHVQEPAPIAIEEVDDDEELVDNLWWP